MIELKPLGSSNHSALFELAMKAEPYVAGMSLEAFKVMMTKREGWTVWDGPKLIGCVSLSDFQPGVAIAMHLFIDPDYHGRWLTKRVLKEIFSFVFIDLDLPRVSGFLVVDISDSAGGFLLKLGFLKEGEIRKGVQLQGGLHNVVLYGMMREECRWL